MGRDDHLDDRPRKGWSDYQGSMSHDLLGERTRDKQNDLDCIECGRWFPTFDRLARHMAARHGRPTPNLPGDVELPEKQSPVRRTQTAMAKKTKAPKRGMLPTPEADGAGEFNAFIKANDIGKLGAEATLTFTGESRLADGGFGEQLVCEVKYGRQVYDYAIKLSSPSYRILFERFGKDPAKWRGAVKVTIKNFMNKDYIAVARQ